jgi:putative N6-adenine-specific DNA methylase
MEQTAYEKRVKRRISGREHDFFIVCSPGLETVCRSEMVAAGFPDNRMNLIEGGIEFKGRVSDCAAMNLNLRSPSRILLRIGRFKADSFEKLEKKIRAMDFTLFLPKNCDLKFSVTARKSRLYHSDAIAERCEAVILDQLRSDDTFTAQNPSTQTVFIRADQGEFQISLDSTGELLFKRGVKKKITPAPLRENLAFAMLFWAGFTAGDILLDPMCGSGTFSLEAAMIKAGLPSGFFRSFTCESWPGFSPRAFAHLKKQTEENRVLVSEKQIFASDMDDHALAVMQQNMSGHDFCRTIDLCQKDFFSLNLSTIPPEKKGVIMLNPPYGKRLEEKTNTKAFYREIGKKLLLDFKGWRLGIILPSKETLPNPLVRLQLKPIFHGGLNLFAGIGII